MNRTEACSILGVNESITPEELKKKYKELTRKYHPDINKEDGAEAFFKKINEAYDILSKNHIADESNSGFNPFAWNTNPFNKIRYAENISLFTEISFRESVLGIKKDFTYSRNIKCVVCAGQGQQPINNGCNICHGKGVVTGRQGNMFFSQTCHGCRGQIKTLPCEKCSAQGTVTTQTSINVSIPGGVISGNILRLSNMGNFVGSMMNMDQYTEVHLHITVTPYENLSLQDIDVVSNLDLSLLEAIQGVEKSIFTIYGDKNILIPPLTKNKDEIIIPKLGVNGTGSQRVIINVNYPTNIHELISVLKSE